MPQPHRARTPLLDRLVQNWLEVVLRHVDDERIARVIGQKIGAHRRPCRAGGAIDIADLIDAQRFGEDAVGDAIAAERLERAGKNGAGLGVNGEIGVLLEELEREPIEMQRQCGGQPDRTRADDENGLHSVNSGSSS